LACVVLSFGGVAAAQDAPKAEHGQWIAESWCTGCHAVEGAVSATDVAPSLRQIAKAPGMDEAALRRQLTDPYPPMPDLHLSKKAVELLIAYFASLRTD
jgi:cytochrome c551/c552